MKEKDEGDWRVQYSWKLGQDMLNIRGMDIDEILLHVSHIEEHIEIFRKLPALFNPAQQSLPIGDMRAVPPPEIPVAPAPQAAPTAGMEIGPIVVEKVEEISGMSKEKVNPKTGKIMPPRPYTRHVVTFRSGVKATTFDALWADVAMKLIGNLCYARVQPGQYGNDLVSIRPAA